jgi:hypothetical protein
MRTENDEQDTLNHLRTSQKVSTDDHQLAFLADFPVQRLTSSSFLYNSRALAEMSSVDCGWKNRTKLAARNESPMVVLVSENNRTKTLLVAAYSWTTITDTRILYIHRYSGVVGQVYIDRA